VKIYEAFKNDDVDHEGYGAKRFTIKIPNDSNMFIAIKTFDDEQQELWTFKVWHGDYKKVIKYWNTNVKFEPTEEDVKYVDNVLDKTFASLVKIFR
jgi:hypothetical protein